MTGREFLEMARKLGIPADEAERQAANLQASRPAPRVTFEQDTPPRVVSFFHGLPQVDEPTGPQYTPPLRREATPEPELGFFARLLVYLISLFRK